MSNQARKKGELMQDLAELRQRLAALEAELAELRHAEKDVLQAQQEFQALAEESPVGIYLIQGGRFRYVNPRLAAMFGYSRQEILSSLSPLDLVVEEDRDLVRENIERRLRGEVQSLRYSFRGKRRDGTMITLESLGCRIDLRGEPAIIGTLLDLTEQKRMEVLLQERQRLLERILDTEPGVVYIYDLLERRNIYINRHWLALYGYTPEETQALGEDLLPRIFHPEDLPRIAQHHQAWRRADEGEVREIEYRIRSRAGDWRWLHSRETAFSRDESGLVCQILGIAQDITERRRTEEALRNSEERYRAIMEQSPLGIFLVDANTKRITHANSAFQQLLGYSGEEIVGLSLYDFVAADKEDIDRRFQQKLEREGPLIHERQYRRKDGSLVDVWISAQAISYGGRQTTCNIVHDITQRKQAEKALKESEERYRAIMEQSPEGIYLVDMDSKRILEANPAFQRLLGYSPEEIQGLSLYDLVAVGPEEVDQRFQQIRSNREPMIFERRYRKRDGSTVEVEVSTRVISYGGREAVCALVRDLTEKKALEDQLLRAQRMETIGLLAGGIAHDLNNILTPILMNAELLQGMTSQPHHQKLLASICSSAQRGADIVRQILAFSRRGETEKGTVSSRHLLKGIQEFVQETFPPTISVQAHIPPDLWPLEGDPGQLHQLLLNLCVNARDAMQKGGTLTISGENLILDASYAGMHPEAHPGPYVLFSVADTGCGIPPEHLEKIFDPFFTTKPAGTGLGLATASAIVKAHRGFLTVDSQVGKGSCFRIYLPASPARVESKEREERMPPPAGQGEWILLLEDDASVREILRTALETAGYRVFAAADGAEGIVLYSQNRGISLVITDMAMPLLDGPNTIRSLLKIEPSLPIIAMSGAAWEQKAAEAMNLKIEAFLAKPFTAEMLLKVVSEVLQRRKQEAEGQETAQGL